MLKYFLIMLMFFSVLNAENWHKIERYSSKKISEDKYQIEIINDGNFTENMLFLDKNNNDLILRGNCYYYSERSKNEKIFDFIGDGSIKCDNNKSVVFISQVYPHIPFYLFLEELFYDFLCRSYPIIGMIVIVGGLLVVAMIRGITMLLFVWLVFGLFLEYAFFSTQDVFCKYLSDKYKKDVSEYFEKKQKATGKIYYIDPRITYL